MKLVTFLVDGDEKIGAVENGRIHDVTAVDASLPNNMVTLLAQGEAGLAKMKTAVSQTTNFLALDAVTLLPPVVRPGKVIALGRNYAAHAAEGGANVPDFPMLFHKTHTSLIGHLGTIVIPPISQQVDFEGELAVIIGKRCKAVSEQSAMEFVAGYTVANDVSARDLQFRTSQFTSGKMVDTFCPLGPWFVTKDDVLDPHNLRLRTSLNGETMQDDNTRHMIFNIPTTVSYISQITTLEPGDVILTGTPEGVGAHRTPPVFMGPGDKIVVEIESIGRLENTVEY